jgi:CRP/FNR family transcriptional regulator
MDILKLAKPLLDRCITKRYEQGNIILYQGEVPRFAYVIKSGSAKVYNITTKGEEQVVTFQIAGELFPSPWIFGKTTSTLYYYEALTPCEVVSVPRDDLLELINKTPKLMQAFLEYFVTAYTGAQLRISALEQSKAGDKILYTLYYLAQRYGQRKKDRTVMISLELTHQQLANLIGLTRETTATEMHKLKKRGIVNYHQRKHYLIRQDKLLAAMGEDSFESIKL